MLLAMPENIAMDSFSWFLLGVWIIAVVVLSCVLLWGNRD